MSRSENYIGDWWSEVLYEEFSELIEVSSNTQTTVLEWAWEDRVKNHIPGLICDPWSHPQIKRARNDVSTRVCAQINWNWNKGQHPEIKKIEDRKKSIALVPGLVTTTAADISFIWINEAFQSTIWK